MPSQSEAGIPENCGLGDDRCLAPAKCGCEQVSRPLHEHRIAGHTFLYMLHFMANHSFLMKDRPVMVFFSMFLGSGLALFSTFKKSDVLALIRE